jgi:UDP-N-acetylmuramate--alanine ligase
MIYFIGIKGTGMSALACMLNDLGQEVSGSDLEKHFFTEDELIKRNIKIFPFNKNNVSDNMTIIIGNAFDEDFPEVVAARENKTCKCFRYHEYLGELMKNYVSYSIAGSHGKTTTTGMLSSMLSNIEDTAYLIGDGTGYIDNDSVNLVVESCEYKRHFLAYYPDYAVITNIEIDHVDYFKSEQDYLSAYQEFCKNVKKAIVIFGDDPESRKIKTNKEHYFYGLNDDNDVIAKNIIETNKSMSFDLYFKGNFIYRFNLNYVARHLLWNSLAVITIGLLRNIDPEIIEEGLNNFKGVKRRYVVEEHGDNIFIDDYAHHPTEVKVTIESTRIRYPDKKIIAIFKPHRVGRVYYFRDQFKDSLNLADKVYLCDFTSIDDQEEGIDIDINYLKDVIKDSEVLEENENGAMILSQYHNVVFLFMSSKDIYYLADLVKKHQS